MRLIVRFSAFVGNARKNRTKKPQTVKRKLSRLFSSLSNNLSGGYSSAVAVAPRGWSGAIPGLILTVGKESCDFAHYNDGARHMIPELYFAPMDDDCEGFTSVSFPPKSWLATPFLNS
jgi:hypothetical protein